MRSENFVRPGRGYSGESMFVRDEGVCVFVYKGENFNTFISEDIAYLDGEERRAFQTYDLWLKE